MDINFTQMILQMAMMMIPSLVGGIGGAIIGVLKTQKKNKENTDKSLKLLIKMELREMHRKIVVEGAGCSLDDKDDATQLYEVYDALGGNGTGKSMYQDIMSAPITN